MVAVVQRVSSASVTVDGKIVGSIGKGFAILLGVGVGDDEKEADALALKIAKMRIFTDENGKMNLSLSDVSGETLVISQFTLLANYKHGNRPDFFGAAEPKLANELYEYFVKKLDEETGKTSARGIFGAHMVCNFVNDGPVTIVMDSKELKK